MPFRKKGTQKGFDPPEGFWDDEYRATSAFQQEATSRLGRTLKLEQEAFLTQNPEIKTLLVEYFSNVANNTGKSEVSIKEASAQIIELCDKIDGMGCACQKPPHTSGLCCQNAKDKPTFIYEDENIKIDLKQIQDKHYPPPPIWTVPSPSLPTPNTISSSFISIMTSVTTLPTPEPVATPEPTLSQAMMELVSNTVDKSIYGRVNDDALRYDTAYIEVAKAVENAMEIPVIDIKVDIAELFFGAYRMFELDIMEKERIAAEAAWEKRMRKKLKKTLRRMHNYKGYETPPTPKSQVSSHESYLIPPPRPCPCHPQFQYNRYPKDRFGIYLPQEIQYSKDSVTAPPTLEEDEDEQQQQEQQHQQ